MKTTTFAALATATATATASAVASLASASKYNAVCVFAELQCGGSIQLREYTPTHGNSCVGADCMAIVADNVTTFSALPTCTDDHITDTARHLKGKPYVIVENYAGSGCAGDFTNAVAVVANGKCYPGAKGDRSYMATLGASDLSVSWMQYMGGDCSGNATTVSFTATEVDRKACVKDTMRALAVQLPGSGSETTAANASTSTPAPSSSGMGAPISLVVGVLTAAAASMFA